MKTGIINLRECKTNLWNGNEFVTIPIYESVFYKSLVNDDKESYEAYRTLVNGTCRWGKVRFGERQVCSYEKFLELYESIKNEGWHRDSYIRLARGTPYIIADGQHRASILLHMNFEVKVLKTGRKVQPVI